MLNFLKLIFKRQYISNGQLRRVSLATDDDFEFLRILIFLKKDGRSERRLTSVNFNIDALLTNFHGQL